MEARLPANELRAEGEASEALTLEVAEQLCRAGYRVVDRCPRHGVRTLFVFVQAEDGIRDLYVTGVQTCALPILAIVTYLAAGWSVIAALGLAGLTLSVHATALGGGLSHLIGACVHRLRATYGTPGGAAVAGLGLTLAGAVAARTAFTATTYLRATGR